jgi:DNA polymerase-3 subunit beta
MNLTIQRESLLRPLQLVMGVVERRQTLPILSNVLLTVEGDQLSITGTDLEVELIARSVLDTPVKEPAKVTVPGRKLMDIFRALPEQAMIEFVKDKSRIIVRSGRSRFVLSTLPAEDFPLLENNESQFGFSIEQKSLHTLLHRTHFAMAQQDVRYYLNGLLIEIKGSEMRTVATDGHRLALNTIPAPMDANHINPFQVIMPRKGVVELMRLLQSENIQVNTTVADNHVRIHGPDFTFTTKLIDGRYPDYEKVLPNRAGAKSIVIDRAAFKEALIRASILSNEKFRGIRLQLRSGLLRLAANNPDHEESEEIIQTDYEGEDVEIGFNANYLLDVLNTVNSASVKLSFIDANSSVIIEELFEGDDSGRAGAVSVFVVMPLRM